MAKFIGKFGGDFIEGTRDIVLNSYIVFQSDEYCWTEDSVTGQRFMRKKFRNWYELGYSDEFRVPRGSVVNGASIPKIAMPIVGSPFAEGRRKSSAIHDVMCKEKKFPYMMVHGLFREMVRFESGESTRGKLMGWAVVNFGPRW